MPNKNSSCGKSGKALPKVTMGIKPKQLTERIVTREIGGNTILMNLVKTSKELNFIYTLNGTATKAWEKFNGKTTLSDISNTLSETYHVTEARLERELFEFVKDLVSIKAITYKKGASKLTPKPKSIHKKSTQKKLPWIPIKITRVKLDPSQAVLSCCVAPSRGAVDFHSSIWYQCLGNCPASGFQDSAS